jgi:hypothetical protein
VGAALARCASLVLRSGNDSDCRLPKSQGATDKDYTAGFDVAIDRERRGLALPPEPSKCSAKALWVLR